MAQINPVSRPQERERPEKDPLDQILKGLQIATSVYGIKEASERAKLLAEQRSEEKQVNALAIEKGGREKAEFERKQGGIFLPEELVGKGQISNQAAPGALPIKLRVNGQDQPAYLTPPKKEVDPLAQALRAQQLADAQRKAQEAARDAKEIAGPKAQAATYGRRMEQADKIISGMTEEGYDRTSAFGALDAKAPAFLQSPSAKKQSQAERNFVNAVLRKESGAAISPSEFASAEEQYFPRVGDNAEVLAQKAQNRAQAIAGLKAEAGRAWDQIDLAPTPTLNAEAAKQAMDVLGVSGAKASSGGGFENTQDAAAKLLQQRSIKTKGMAGKLPK